MKHNQTRRDENIGNNILHSYKTFFGIALDKSIDIIDTTQLLIIIRGIDINFNITEELRSLQSMHDQTGADIFKKVDSCLRDVKLDWINLSCITTGGVSNTRRENIGFIDRVNKLLKLKNIEPPINMHCNIH